jgi:hypothetical protein
MTGSGVDRIRSGSTWIDPGPPDGGATVRSSDGTGPFHRRGISTEDDASTVPSAAWVDPLDQSI